MHPVPRRRDTSSPPRRQLTDMSGSDDRDPLIDPLFGLLNADSAERLLSDGVRLLAKLSDASAGAGFLIEAQRVLHEAWYPDAEAPSAPFGPQLRSLALES